MRQSILVLLLLAVATAQAIATGRAIFFSLAYALLSSSGELAGGVALHRRIYFVTTNVAGVRDYYPGDSLNRIHWPSTACTGRLVAKEFELAPTADVWLCVDMSQGVQAERVEAPLRARVELSEHSLGALEPSTEEYVVAVTASIAKYYLDRNRAVGSWHTACIVSSSRRTGASGNWARSWRPWRSSERKGA